MPVRNSYVNVFSLWEVNTKEGGSACFRTLKMKFGTLGKYFGFYELMRARRCELAAVKMVFTTLANPFLQLGHPYGVQKLVNHK